MKRKGKKNILAILYFPIDPALVNYVILHHCLTMVMVTFSQWHLATNKLFSQT